MTEPLIPPGSTVYGDVVAGDKIVINTGGGDYYESAPPVGVAALHQLPAPPADFVGRAGALRELARAIVARGVGLCGLRGMGGLGKTALALKLAEQLQPNFPDAQFFIRLEGLSAAPLDPGEALGRVIRAYAPAAPLPEGVDERRAQYLSLLAGKRALLVLDDAREAGQVLPLLPPAGCLLLVTTRQHFALPGWQAHDLRLLSRGEARQLLVGIAPRLKGEADEIARLCGYLPLALRAAAGLLAASPDLEPPALAQALRAEQARLRLSGPRSEGLEISVAALFNLSCANLLAETARVFRRLAVFPDDFDAAAEEAIGEDADHIGLSDLVRRSLVDFRRKRYRLHDLVRDFARSRLSGAEGAAEAAAAARRHATYYRQALAAADARYLQGGEAMAAGLALFDLERANILAGQAWAAGQPEADEVAAALTVTYPDAGLEVLSLRLRPSERVGWLRPAVAAARRLGASQVEGAHLGNLGVALAEMGQPDQALAAYQAQLDLALERGDRHGQATALGHLGTLRAEQGQTNLAIELYSQQLEMVRALGLRREEGFVLNNLGLAAGALGDAAAALAYFQEALAIFEALGDRRSAANVLGNLGSQLAQAGKLAEAMAQYQRYLEAARALGDRRGEALALGNLGNAYAAQDEPGQALAHYEQSLAIARELGDRRSEATGLGNIGNAHLAQGEAAAALPFLEQALVLMRTLGDRRGEASALAGLGNAFAAQGDGELAMAHYQQALGLAQASGDRQSESIARWNLGSALEKQGRLGEAIAQMEMRVDYLRAVGHPEAEARAAAVEGLRRRMEEGQSG